jgi:transketolase
MSDTGGRPPQSLQDRCIDTIRFLAVDAVERAKSGHPGMPMGAAAMAFTLWTRYLKHDPAEPEWPDRDRFVLSAGHGSMLLYALLHLTGYGLTLDDLRAFRQLGARTAGHPEYGLAPGIETTTGPLGQGLAMAVGMAIAEAHLAARSNRDGAVIVDHHTYVIVGDGDLMEGVASEAASLAGHLGLGKLIVLYDDNHVSIEGSTDLAFTEDRAARFAAYGWQVLRVDDGNDLDAVDAAITAARADVDRPSLICARTHIGFGAPHKQDTAAAHGEPLGPDEARAAKEALGWPPEPAFLVPDDVLAFFRQALPRGEAARADWQACLSGWRRDWPDLAAEWERCLRRELPDGWDTDLPVYAPQDGGVATRAASGAALNALAARLPELIGGSADLAPSNNTSIKGGGDFSAENRGGRILHFGVREHAMAAVCNGMALHGGLRPYGGTFFVFADYMRPALRLSALMGLPVVYVFTHDSIGLGEDGPTHQPIEHLAILRATPGMTALRPADANEAVLAWRLALQHDDGPVALVLTRQKLPTIDRTRYGAAEGIGRGAYVLADAPGGAPEVILIGSGSEVQLCLAAHERLTADGVRARVVNLASWELFAAQDRGYIDQVLPPQVWRRVAVEAGASFGWERWTGTAGEIIALDHFGASAPADKLFEHFGLTADAVHERAVALLRRPAPTSSPSAG